MCYCSVCSESMSLDPPLQLLCPAPTTAYFRGAEFRTTPAAMDPLDGFGSPGREEAAADSRSAWTRFSSWLECVCVVTFDLELGQAIEVR